MERSIRQGLAFFAALALAPGAAPSRAQTGGHIGIHPDANSYSECELADETVGLCPVYVVHQLSSAKGAQFRIVNDAGLAVVGTVYNHATNNGDPFTGFAVVYDGGCSSPPTLILTINFFCQGTSPACAEVRVANDPTLADILSLDCSDVERTVTGGTLYVNASSGCTCEPSIKSSTWGRIKSFYQ